MTIQPETLLTYALYLSSLTYFLGVLFYALPIPMKRIKKWGPTLIKDSIYSLVWLSIYNIIFYLAHLIMYYLNISWHHYFNVLLSDIINLAIVEMILMLFSLAESPGLLSIVPSSGWGKVLYGIAKTGASIANIKALSDAIEGSLTTYLVIYYLSEIIYYATPWLIALGVLLMSLPFRIGRSAGAGFIATALTFYVGLPLMPEFASDLTFLIYDHVFASLTVNTIQALISLSILNAIGYFILYYIISRVLYFFILIEIANALGRVIAENAVLPIRLDLI